ncbi:hypothetical protein QBC44DRAFT_404631 [Cladorrhinum sp. PSN332]|nr:hypothetical protein QBC44DRAFT_404631 [Cladorrhinum sp. PSN332]
MVASQLVRVTTPPPSEDDICRRLPVHCFSIEPRLPLLFNLPDGPSPCWESLDVFEAINTEVSAQVHTFFNAPFGVCDSTDCCHRAIHTRRLTIENRDTLPLLNHVAQLRFFSQASAIGHGVRPFSPRVPLDLATRPPSLRWLECPWLWERLPIAFESKAPRIFFRIWAGPWRDYRAEFARGVRDTIPLLPYSLTKARLWFWMPRDWGDHMDQAMQMPDLVGAPDDFEHMDQAMRQLTLSSTTIEFEGKDPVSLGLRSLGSLLEELDIRALITPDLFPCGSSQTNLWSKMRHLKVEFYPCAPDGRWYFCGPRGEDPYPTGFNITEEEHYPPAQEHYKELHELLWDEMEENDTGDVLEDVHCTDTFRILPIADRINPLLLTFALSIQLDKMPLLQDAELFTWLRWYPSEARAKEYEGSDDAPSSNGDGSMVRWGVKYDGPREGGDRKGTLTWQVGRNWKPSPEVIEAFRELVDWDGVNMEWKDLEFVEERGVNFCDYI